MKNKTFLITSVCIAAFVGFPLAAFSADKKTSAPAASVSPAAKTDSSSATAKPPRPIPFRGTISAVDQSAKTFTIAGKEKSRVFKVTANTVVTKDGQPATMADITENSAVTGSYWKHEDESLEAKTVKIGGPAAEKKESKKNDKASPKP